VRVLGGRVIRTPHPLLVVQAPALWRNNRRRNAMWAASDHRSDVLHTYPITIAVSDPWPQDADYEKAALSAAKVAKLVPESEFASLKTRLQ
jgi:hypothetical protein